MKLTAGSSQQKRARTFVKQFAYVFICGPVFDANINVADVNGKRLFGFWMFSHCPWKQIPCCPTQPEIYDFKIGRKQRMCSMVRFHFLYGALLLALSFFPSLISFISFFALLAHFLIILILFTPLPSPFRVNFPQANTNQTHTSNKHKSLFKELTKSRYIRRRLCCCCYQHFIATGIKTFTKIEFYDYKICFCDCVYAAQLLSN